MEPYHSQKMKIKIIILLPLVFVLFCTNIWAFSNKPIKKDIYQIKVYHLKSNEQVVALDVFLQNAYLPALHRVGIKNIGVFKNLGIDTASEKTIYVWMPLRSIDQLSQIEDQLKSDIVYNKDGASFLLAPFNTPTYTRIESIMLRAFSQMPHYNQPSFTTAVAERIYELRSYEAASEKLYQQKVKMFNEGGEIALFNRLGFNAAFYAEVLSGSHMPNLMYMTSFENIASRNEHWKIFGADPEWKKLSALPEYKNTVSKADIILLHPTAYSEL
jgi:hypothetical protein